MSANREQFSGYISQNVEKFTDNVTDLSEFRNSKNDLDSVTQHGLTLGEQPLYTDIHGKEHTVFVLSSEEYDRRTNPHTGEITAWFHQYTTIPDTVKGPDEFGLIHPHTVPHQELVFENGRMHQDNSQRTIALSGGSESQRVLVVTEIPSESKDINGDPSIESYYLHKRDMRYALDDKQRLDAVRKRKTNTVDGTSEDLKKSAGIIYSNDLEMPQDTSIAAD
jgi:hypothetical protein